MQSEFKPIQIENWIGHELSRPMPCDISTPIGRLNLDTTSRQLFITSQQMRSSPGTIRDRDHRRIMFHKE